MHGVILFSCYSINTCLEMDSLLYIETKKPKDRQTDKDFNFHNLLSLAPLAHRVQCSTEPLFTFFSIKMSP